MSKALHNPEGKPPHTSTGYLHNLQDPLWLLCRTIGPLTLHSQEITRIIHRIINSWQYLEHTRLLPLACGNPTDIHIEICFCWSWQKRPVEKWFNIPSRAMYFTFTCNIQLRSPQDSITYPFFALSAWFASFQPSCQVSFKPFCRDNSALHVQGFLHPTLLCKGIQRYWFYKLTIQLYYASTMLV